jgi:hypothetical protein
MADGVTVNNNDRMMASSGVAEMFKFHTGGELSDAPDGVQRFVHHQVEVAAAQMAMVRMLQGVIHHPLLHPEG